MDTRPSPLPDTAALLKALVQSSEDAIISKDLNGTVTSWNPAAERLFGYSAAEAIGQSIRIIVPPDRQDEETAVLDKISRGELIEHYETFRRRKDGTIIPISLTVSPIRTAHGIVGASKIARDITDRKQAQEAAERVHARATFLGELTRAMSESLARQRTLTNIATLAVPGLADWCAVDILRSDGEVARLAVAHVDPDKIPIAMEVRRRYENPNAPYSPAQVIRTGVPAHIPEISDDMLITAAGGDEERLRMTRALGLTSYICVPLVARGRSLGALTLATAASKRIYTTDDLAFAEDIASRAALAVDNARSYERLEEANRGKDEFLATLSHELRTPLNAILGYARMAAGGLLTGERLTRAIETIDRNATMLTQMVEDILDVSRIVSGKMRLQVQPVDVPLVLHDAIETVRPAADAKRIQMHAVIDPQVGPISGDPDRLGQIAWNLLSNAVKFTPKGGKIQLSLERVNSSIEIIVSDTGIGISPDFIPHLFERFRQADSGMSRQHGGLGLGLAIVRNLVELHGGSVHASSDGPDKGATFRVRLPVRIAHADTHEEKRVHPRRETRTTPQTLPSLQGIHVLAVDDEPDALKLLTEILETAGARVTTARSGAAALDKIAAIEADVLVADLGMPLMDGFELITRLRASDKPAVRSLPAAALTAYARSEDRAKTLQGGFEMHLAKPIDPVELVSAVKALTRRRDA